MATNAEAVGQLLANSALMKGERELLRKQEEPPAEATKAAAQPPAEPIVNNSKTVATVLLTLLDEQLHATETALASPLKNAISTDGDADAPKRVAAKYAADGLIPGDDSVLPGPAIPGDQTRMREMPSIVSADLQTFVQRFAAFAAGRSSAANENTAGGRSSIGAAATFFNRASALRVAGAIAALLWFVVLVAQWVAR